MTDKPYEYVAIAKDGSTVLAVRRGFKGWIKAMFGAWNDGWSNENCDRIVVGTYDV